MIRDTQRARGKARLAGGVCRDWREPHQARDMFFRVSAHLAHAAAVPRLGQNQNGGQRPRRAVQTFKCHHTDVRRHHVRVRRPALLPVLNSAAAPRVCAPTLLRSHHVRGPQRDRAMSSPTSCSEDDNAHRVLLRPRPYARVSGALALLPLLPHRTPPRPLPSEVWAKILAYLFDEYKARRQQNAERSLLLICKTLTVRLSSPASFAVPEKVMTGCDVARISPHRPSRYHCSMNMCI